MADLERVAPFEVEGQLAKRSSTAAFLSAVAIVLVVLGMALRDWWNHEGGQEITTGTGLARLGAVLAAFYVAGQLFKRSTALQIRSQEFERAAIAMKVTPGLADQIRDLSTRDVFVKNIYTSHLSSSGRSGADDGTNSASLDVASIIDAYSKLKGGG